MSKVNEVFTPSAPIKVLDLFSGRSEQVQQVADSIVTTGQHAVLYGERGVGKTSLANIVKILIEENLIQGLNNIIVSKTVCDSRSSFDSIWNNLLSNISVTTLRPAISFNNESVATKSSLREYIEHINPSSVVRIFNGIQHNCLLMLDEYDRITDQDTKRQVVDVIKQCSDELDNVTVLIVGVGQTVIDIIGEHQSTERCLKQIMLPKMTKDELNQIIEKGSNKLGMLIEPDVRKQIVNVSDGFPHYTHLLCKYAFESALSKKIDIVDRDCYRNAIESAVGNAQQSIRESYRKAIHATKDDTLFHDVVVACALTKCDEFNSFKANDLSAILSDLRKRDYTVRNYLYHLGRLCDAERGPMLVKSGSKKSYRYSFHSPMLKPYILIEAINSGIIPDTRMCFI